MEKEFVLYEPALELKELGFDEPCFGRYDGKGKHKGKIWYEMPNQGQDTIPIGDILAPTFSQAFRWFRKKYKLNSQIAFCEYGVKSENGWRFTLDNPTGEQFWGNKFSSYEKAELACLKELIEIVKNK